MRQVVQLNHVLDDKVNLILFIVIYIWVLGYLMVELFEMKKLGIRKYCYSSANMVDLTILGIFFVIFAFQIAVWKAWAEIQHHDQKSLEGVGLGTTPDATEFISLFKIATWQQVRYDSRWRRPAKSHLSFAREYRCVRHNGAAHAVIQST